VYLHEQCWVVGNNARGRAARVDDPELRLNRHAVVLDEAVLHRLVINIDGVQERRVEEELPCYRMLKAPPILEPALQTPRAQVGGEGEALPTKAQGERLEVPLGLHPLRACEEVRRCLVEEQDEAGAKEGEVWGFGRWQEL